MKSQESEKQIDRNLIEQKKTAIPKNSRKITSKVTVSEIKLSRSYCSSHMW